MQIDNEKDFKDCIFGKNAVLEALKTGNRTINKIFLQKGLHTDSKVEEIINLAKKNNILFQFAPKEKFVQYKEFSYQGVVAYCAPVKYKDLHEFIENAPKNAKVVVLDGVEDPHNVGSIIRTAVCAGFDAVILPQRRSAVINSTVEKSSAGAVNHIDLIIVNSLSGAIETLKKNNYWVIATEAKGKDNYFEVDYTNSNIVIVMGSEKTGVSRTILKQADFTVKIPMFRNFDSLNVANATSIIIYEVVKQNIQNGDIVV